MSPVAAASPATRALAGPGPKLLQCKCREIRFRESEIERSMWDASSSSGEGGEREREQFSLLSCKAGRRN
jgi:hypothetical protein